MEAGENKQSLAARARVRGKQGARVFTFLSPPRLRKVRWKMRRILPPLALMALTMLVCVGALLALATGPAQGAPVPTDPNNFTYSQVTNGLTNPTDMEFSPDGRLFVAEQAGRVRIVKPDGTFATFLNISTKVNSSGERGLQALTFDPKISTNRYVYLHYTKKATSTTPVHNRVVRVTASGDKVVSGSEKLIFKLGNQTSDHHMGGAIEFDTHGKLYIATGDNETPTRAQQLTNLFGKMLRINKDGTIPIDNPFYSKASGNNRAIWALGLRNPFKFAIQPTTDTTTTDTIFINDVGKNTWEEINQGAPGANYGWPVHEGVANDPTTALFPQEYEGDYFFADFCNGWIRTREATTGEVSGFATGLERPIDLEVGKAGELYYLARGNTDIPASVGKIGYAGN
jgi:glucose/arabinose dehydrogenase